MSKKSDMWVVEWAKEHIDELVPLRGMCVYLHPEHGIVGVARDVVAGLNQARFVKKSIRKECAHVDVNAILQRAGWRDPKLPPKRKVYQVPKDWKPPTPEELESTLEEGRRAQESLKPRLDQLSAPYDVFDTDALIDGGGAAWREREEASRVTLHTMSTKLGVKSTELLMFLLSEGMKGIHLNTQLDEETQQKVEARFKKPEPIVEVTTPTSESLPRSAIDSPHKQPPFQPTKVDRSRMVIDGGGAAWRNRMRFD